MINVKVFLYLLWLVLAVFVGIQILASVKVKQWTSLKVRILTMFREKKKKKLRVLTLLICMVVLVLVSSCSVRSSSKKLENIDENSPPRWLQLSCPLPETPTEPMEFLARSWSLSAMELSKALAKINIAASNGVDADIKSSSTSSVGNTETHDSRQSVRRKKESKVLIKYIGFGCF